MYFIQYLKCEYIPNPAHDSFTAAELVRGVEAASDRFDVRWDAQNRPTIEHMGCRQFGLYADRYQGIKDFILVWLRNFKEQKIYWTTPSMVENTRLGKAMLNATASDFKLHINSFQPDDNTCNNEIPFWAVGDGRDARGRPNCWHRIADYPDLIALVESEPDV